MPNWCYTNITIVHPSEQKIKEFFKKIDSWSKTTYSKNGFDCPGAGIRWLGNIVGNAGLSEIPEGKTDFVPNIRCRGSITDLSYDGNHIHINTETAWAPMLDMWQRLVDKYLPDADIWYTAEESGCGLYCTNDPDVIGKYYIDLWELPDEFIKETSEYEATEDYTIKFLQRVLKTKETDIQKLLKMADDIEEQWFSINQWKECDISECE